MAVRWDRRVPCLSFPKDLCVLPLEATITTMAEPPLQTERRKCRFSVTQLTHFLNGGEEETKLKSKIFQAIRRDPFLYHPRPFDMTLEQQREWSVVQLVRVTQIFKELGNHLHYFIFLIIFR